MTTRSRPSERSRDVQHLVAILDRAYDRRSWHGTNLRSSFGRLSPEHASWRPAPGRHNIWEVVVHAAYWKYRVWRLLTAAERRSFPLKGSNWFRRPDRATGRSWSEDVALLDQMHRSLRAAVVALRPAHLPRRATASGFTTFELVAGIAAHDLYHAGQIQLLKRLRQG